MKNRVIFLLCLLLAVVSLSAQQKFNVQNGTKAEFYDDLETAIQKAVSGDTIYLPGYPVQVQNDLIIDKKLAIIGAGCDVDSVGGLLTTEIKKANGDATVNFLNGSDGSLLTGCIVGNVQFGNRDEFNVAQQNISNVTLWRNKITGFLYLGIDPATNQVKQIIISENNFTYNNTPDGRNASDCIINNNLFVFGISGLVNSHLYNNVTRSGNITALTNCIVENNFFATGTVTNCTNSTFNNNAFTTDFTFPVGTNLGSNNLMSQETIRTFTVNDLSLPKNLKVRDDSACKNAGTDGRDIGIFGGANPYKDGAVPFNPHINSAAVSSQIDKDGNLNVSIQVSAQTR